MNSIFNNKQTSIYMKSFIAKHIKITFLTSILLLLAFFESAVCQTKKPTTSDLYKNIENVRKVFTGNDSLELHPFEMFSILTFKAINTCAMGGEYSILIMESEKYGTSFYFDGLNNDFKHDNNEIDCDWKGKKATIFLKTIQDTLKRDIYKNEKYKVIFSYWNDSEVSRTNIPTENNSGYYIVDIIPLTSLFERQKEFDY